MGRAIRCLIRMVAAWPRLRFIRVCASYNKTFPEHEAFILINPVGETHVPRTAPGTPQANGRCDAPGRPVRPAAGPVRRVPGQANAPLTPRRLVRPPGQRCDLADLAAVTRELQGIRAYPRRHDVPGVARHGAAHRGAAPWTLAKGCPRGAPLAPRKGDEPASPLKTSELRFVRASAQLRTPRRCWRECARAH